MGTTSSRKNKNNNNIDINIESKKKKEEKSIEKKSEIETLKITLNNSLPKPSKFEEDKIRSFGYHKVILGYLNAYFGHCPIKVNPNVIWQLILNLFSEYVNDNSEELRNEFVNFEGKKDIKCIRIGSFKDVYKYEDDLVEEFCYEISKNIGEELIDILTPNFTTSTKESIIAGKVSIMAIFKEYFNYSIDMVACGIPYIILEGNLEDWKKILEKLESLSRYGFHRERIEKDIIEIINTKEGKINLDFWRKIIMETKEIIEVSEPCCEPEKVERNVITGWILDFYDKKYVQKKELNELKEEVIQAPVSIKEIKTGEIKSAIIYAGIRDLKQDPITYVVEPIANSCFSFNECDSEDIDDD